MTTECKGYSVISGYGYGVVIGNGFVVSAELLSTMVFKMDYVLKDKEIYFKNSGSGVDCVGYVASGLELTGNTYIDVKLDHTLGDSFLANSHFDTNVDDWLVDNGVLSFDNGTGKFIVSDSPTGAGITQDINVPEGMYETTYTVTDMSDPDGEHRIYLYSSATWLTTNQGLGTFKEIVNNDSVTTRFKLFPEGTIRVENGFFNVDDVLFRKINMVTQSLWIYSYETNTWDVVTDFTNITHRLELRTIGHYFKLSNTHDQNDIDLLNATPELVLNMILGDTNTGLSFTINDVKYMQPDRYSGKTIQCISTDLIPLVGTYDFGTGTHVNQTKIEEGDNWGIVEQTAQGTHYQFPQFQFMDSRLENKRIKMKATFDVLEGQYYVGTNRGNPGQYNSTGLVGIGTYEVEYDLNDNRWHAIDSYERIGIYGDGTNSGETFKVKCTIDAYMLPEYDDIINHRGLVSYTNVDQQSKGIPLSKYVQDETGRIISKADTGINEFNGDGRYIGVTWNPRDSFVIEGLIEFTEDRLINNHGYSYDTHCCFGGYLGGIYAYFSGTAVNKFNLYTNGYHHLAMRYYGPNHPTKPNLLESYTDGILRNYDTVDTPMLTSNALFYIGSRSNGGYAKPNSGIFIFTDGEQADDWDPLEAYDKMVALYPNKLTPRV